MSNPATMSTHESPDSAAFAAVLAAAERDRLGAHRSTYVPQPVKTWALITNLVFGVLFLVLVFGVIFLVLAFRTPNLNRGMRARRLHLFEHGLILADAKGPTAVLRWDKLTVLQSITQRYVNGIYVGTFYIYTLTGPDGPKTKVTGFFNRPEEWGPAFQNEITRAQLPGTIAALEAGSVLDFGPLSINQGGISTGSRSLRWDEIEDLDIAAGYFRIKKAGRWTRWSTKPVSAIPNFFLFLTAATHLRQSYPSVPRG